MAWSLRVISALTADTEPSLAIICNQPYKKYIFNVGEGMTRSCIQRKFALSKTNAIFLTRLNPQQMGGFPGVIMNLADIGTQDVQVFGPQGLVHYVASTRRYCRRTLLGMYLKECPPPQPSPDGDEPAPPSPILKDETVSIYAIPISSPLNPRARSCSDSSRKRRRSPTPDAPSKRVVEEAKEGSSRSRVPERAAMIADDGEADRIRRGVISEMFRPPGTAYPSSRINQYNDVDVDVIDIPTVTNTAAPSIVTPSRPFGSGRLPVSTHASHVVAYVIVGAPARGKFDVEKTKALGVPKGPLWSKLGNGQTVVTPEGKTVTPEMCLRSSRPPVAFIYVHCPDPSYIDNIVTSQDFNPVRYGSDVTIHAIVHRVGEGVIEDERYKKWMSSFAPEVHHLVAGEEYSPNSVSFTSAATAQLGLAGLDSEIFRIPHHSLSPIKDVPSDLPLRTTVLAHDVEIKMSPPSAPQLLISVGEDTFQPALLLTQNGGGHPHSSGKDMDSPFTDIYSKARAVVEAVASQRPLIVETGAGADVTITTLGTGSAIPSKYRNVSGNIIQIPKWGNILLDCGEGTWGQMARQFGPDKMIKSSSTTMAETQAHAGDPSVTATVDGDVESVIRNLKLIFVSHIHGDHHMGLAKILARRRALTPPPPEPVYIVAPISAMIYLQEYDDLVDLGIRDRSAVRLIDARRFRMGDPENENAGVDEASLESTLGLDSITTVRVLHRVQAFGIVLRHQDGWSVVYSGDTIPCDALVEAGQGATVLIHEATMADDEVEMAAAKAHSTFGQAIDVGRRMHAKNIILTHFSQRYPKFPELKTGPLGRVFVDEAGNTTTEREAPITIGFDCASLKIGSLWKMEHYMDALAKTFPQEEVAPSEGDLAGRDSRPASPTKGKKRENRVKE
ncbi:hypothetical protein FRB96_004415 [Tulasnella sp. 330]|nr:hypothetical protein FRB96_004415 [Tulasnella sp. 330]KAG8884516.1 hypothetical protein FRB97_004029 [Tulasnella sp. 331]